VAPDEKTPEATVWPYSRGTPTGNAWSSVPPHSDWPEAGGQHRSGSFKALIHDIEQATAAPQASPQVTPQASSQASPNSERRKKRRSKNFFPISGKKGSKASGSVDSGAGEDGVPTTSNNSKTLKVATDALHEAMGIAELKLQKDQRTRRLLTDSTLVQRRRVHAFNQHRITKIVVGLIICLNAAYVGIDTDNDFFQGDASTAIEIVFTIIFFFELTLRIYAERGSFFKDGWNLLDFILVFLACLDTMILQWISGSGIAGISAIRVLRLLRLVRVVRLFKAFKELWLFVTGILSAMRTLAWAAPIMILLMYMFGITTTRLFGHKWGDEDDEIFDYFGSVPRSMFTLFQCMTTEGWADIARLTMLYEPWAGFFFVFFLSLTTFAMNNVIVAVIVENAVSTALKDAEDLEKQAEQERVKACEHILQIFTEADTDGNCELSSSEFQAALKKPSVKSWLAAVGIDVRQAETLFDILDYDGSGVLDFNEFVEGVMKARGTASAQDILAVHCDVWRSEFKVLSRVNSLQEEVARLRDESREQFEQLKRMLACQQGGDSSASITPVTSRSRSRPSQPAPATPRGAPPRVSQETAPELLTPGYSTAQPSSSQLDGQNSGDRSQQDLAHLGSNLNSDRFATTPSSFDVIQNIED
jgi:voltage-gated sodium channel